MFQRKENEECLESAKVSRKKLERQRFKSYEENMMGIFGRKKTEEGLESVKVFRKKIEK